MSFKRRILEESKGISPILGGVGLGGLAGGALGYIYGDDIASNYLTHSRELADHYNHEIAAYNDKISKEYPVLKQISDPEGFRPYKNTINDLRYKYWKELFDGTKQADDIRDYATPALGLGGAAAGAAAGASLNTPRQKMTTKPKA